MSSLLRSTKFVRYFTGAARTLILNSAKTSEAHTLINPKTLCAANNVLLREYATAKKTENLEPLLQKLDSEVRRFGRIAKRDIDEVFDEIQSKSDITSSQSLLVIRCCGELVPEELPEQRTLLVQKIWGVLTERGIPMDISHYNALLRVYLENEHPFSPALFLEELERKGLQPNRVTYQRLMWRYCQEGDVEGATKVLEKMRELNLPVSEPVLNALVMGHAFHGDTDGAKAVLETMAVAGLQPTNRTYTLLACGYAKLGDIEGVQNVIATATNKDTYITDKDLLDIMEHLAVGGHGDKVDQLFPHLKKSMGYNQDVCNLILRLLNKGQEDIAKKIMKTMPKSPNVVDTHLKGAFFVKQLVKLNKSSDNVIKTCKELQDEGLVPSAMYIAAESALIHGYTELAQNLFKELKKDGTEIRQHYYWPLLAQKGREGDEEGLLQIVRNMVEEGLVPTGEALRDFIIPHLIGKGTEENVILKLQIANVPTIHSARNVMVELLHAGSIKKAAAIAVKYRPRGQYSLIARSLLNALGSTKDIDSFVTILHVTSSFPPTPQSEEESTNDDGQNDDKVNSNEIGRIVTSAVKILTKPDLCEQLLKAVYAKGLTIGTEAAESIEQYLGQNMTTNLSELLSQLTSPDLELAPIESPKTVFAAKTPYQLERLLAQIKSKGGNNIARIQKQLLSAYIKQNDVEKVNDFLPELAASDFELNISTLAQLYEFYAQNDDIAKAKEIQAQIVAKDPEFVLNKYKVVQMAYALVRAKQFDEGLNLLNENKPRDDDDTKSFVYNSKCWQMLNYLAEEKDDVKVKKMTQALLDNGYIEPSNVLLGPCIKVHIMKDDIEAALKEFEVCCKTYRSTPWKGELMKSLIMKEDAAKLQWLADLSTQIHGEVNILHDLVLAFVECGRLRQARRILETPGLHYRHKRLDDACLRYVEEGKSEHIEGLLEATKELSHIDRSNIFYHLLVTYCKADETDKALGIWTLLQEEDEVPSEQFLIYLANHLKSKNREVPFAVPATETKTVKATPTVDLVQNATPKVKQSIPVTNKNARNSVQSTKKEISDEIEALVQSGKITEATEATIKSLKSGAVPDKKVLKFLLKHLAEKGDMEAIHEVGNFLDENMKRNVTFEGKLTHAVFVQGGGAKHLDSLLEAANAAHTEEDLELVTRKFPKNTSLEAAVLNNDQIIKKCHEIAEIAASKGQAMPANLLWMEYILAGKDQEADSLWKLCLANSNFIIFRRLLQEGYTRNQPQLIEKLISALHSNQRLSMGSMGVAYSRLINLYLTNNRTGDALAAFERAIKSGVQASHFNTKSIEMLRTVAEAGGMEFNYSK